jgi:hypothetical protein
MEWTVNGSAIVKDVGGIQIRVPVSVRDIKIPNLPKENYKK